MRELIEKFEPIDEYEQSDKENILKCMEMFDDVLTRNNSIAHFTSSSIIFNKTMDKILMIYHNIYQSWSWTGGHCDGDDDLYRVAYKEAIEETGISKLEPLTKDIVAVDIIPVARHFKKGKAISSHLHLNVSYAFVGDENDELRVKEDENSGVKWIEIEKLEEYSNEPRMIEIYRKIINRVKR